MDTLIPSMAFLLACGCMVAAWGTLDAERWLRNKVKWPLIGAVCLFAFVAWERQNTINRACRVLDVLEGFQETGLDMPAAKTLEDATKIVAITPEWIETRRICKAATNSLVSEPSW